MNLRPEDRHACFRDVSDGAAGLLEVGAQVEEVDDLALVVWIQPMWDANDSLSLD